MYPMVGMYGVYLRVLRVYLRVLRGVPQGVERGFIMRRVLWAFYGRREACCAELSLFLRGF